MTPAPRVSYFRGRHRSSLSAARVHVHRYPNVDFLDHQAEPENDCLSMSMLMANTHRALETCQRVERIAFAVVDQNVRSMSDTARLGNALLTLRADNDVTHDAVFELTTALAVQQERVDALSDEVAALTRALSVALETMAHVRAGTRMRNKHSVKQAHYSKWRTCAVAVAVAVASVAIALTVVQFIECC